MIQLYGTADIAESLGVTIVVVGKWIRERNDVPAPSARVAHGGGYRYYYDASGLAQWKRWYRKRVDNDPRWRSNRYRTDRKSTLKELS